MLIFDKLLRECWLHPHMHPGSSLTIGFHYAEDHPDCFGEDRVCFWSSIFNDGEHIYRIGQYDGDESASWHARWPD